MILWIERSSWIFIYIATTILYRDFAVPELWGRGKRLCLIHNSRWKNRKLKFWNPEREKVTAFGIISNFQISTTVKKNKLLSSGHSSQRRILPWCGLALDHYLCSLNRGQSYVHKQNYPMTCTLFSEVTEKQSSGNHTGLIDKSLSVNILSSTQKISLSWWCLQLIPHPV